MTKKDIERFFTGRFKTYKTEKITLRVSKNGFNTTKTAFIISSAVNKNAVARNKTRRRINEIVRSLLPGIKAGHNLVFSYRLENKKAPSFFELRNDIINLLTLCGVL